jgi:NOL1/NOP2/fmu family ribosome biogenesis protein
MNFKIQYANENEISSINKTLNKQFGIKKIDGKLIRAGEERIRIFTGELSENELINIQKFIRIEGIGLYIAKEERGEIRLSIEGSQILGGQSTKNTYELKDNQVQQWMEGADIMQKNDEKRWVIIKNKDDFLGSGRMSAEKISNHIPKPRRLKIKE